MGYKVRTRIGNRTLYGNRIYKTLAGAKKSINSKEGKDFIRKYKLKKVTIVKQRDKK